MPPKENQVSLPWKLLLTAFVIALLGLGGWSLNLERLKADKGETREALERKADKETVAGVTRSINEKLGYIQGRLDKYIDLHENAKGKAP